MENIILAIMGVISITWAQPLSALIEDNTRKHIVRSWIVFLSNESQIWVQIAISKSLILRAYSSILSRITGKGSCIGEESC